MAKYPLSERQTDAILELRLYQLTGLERDKIEAEYLELMKIIEELRGILESDAKLMALIKEELQVMKEKYSSPRKTQIVAANEEIRMEDVIPNEGCVITVSHLGFIKRTRVADYRSQKRGGKGIIGTETYEDDFVEYLFTASTHDYILFMSSSGQCHAKKVYDVPEGTRTSRESPYRVSCGWRMAKSISDDLREGLYRRTPSRDGNEEGHHEEDKPKRLHERHTRGRAKRNQARGRRFAPGLRPYYRRE